MLLLGCYWAAIVLLDDNEILATDGAADRLLTCRVKFKSQTIYFVIMSSVFNTDKAIHIKFDLKGSTKGRETSEAECRSGSVQKDINLMKSGAQQRVMH